MKTKALSPLTSFGVLLVLLITSGIASNASNSVTTCGTVITSSGKWTLANNLNCTGDGIDIEASNVTLKLNGFTITGPGTNTTTNGVLVVSAAGTGLKVVAIVGPGTITNFHSGVSFVGTNGGGAVDVTSTANLYGFSLASDPLGTASANLVISQNNLQKNLQGINAEMVTMSAIVGNNCSSNTDGINLFAGNGNKLFGNTCDNDNHAGMIFGGFGSSGTTGNTLEGNQTSNNRFYGIFLGPGANGERVIGNTALGNRVLDISDQNQNCGTDTYVNNVFGTADDPCIK